MAIAAPRLDGLRLLRVGLPPLLGKATPDAPKATGLIQGPEVGIRSGAFRMADTLNAPLLESLAPNLLPELKAYLERHRAELMRMLASESDAGTALGCRHAKIMDGLLTALYPAAFATMKQQKRWSPVLLAAVGGYGRGVVG